MGSSALAADVTAGNTSTIRSRARVRAPELTGRGGWLNTGGRDLSLADLRGRFVLLDFWTFCCVNCLHVINELRPLEAKYGDALVVIGVHSPKFVHEADHDAVAAAVQRYEVTHPVLDDPDLSTWSAYTARAWPTLVLVDPEGYIVAQMAGEGHAHSLDATLAELVAEHDARGTLRHGDDPYVPPPVAETELRFPGKALALPGGTFLVSDSGHHSIVELAADGETVLRRIGDGRRGLVDGGPDQARFAEPQGLCLLPPELRPEQSTTGAHGEGYEVVVADTANHVLRGLRLADGHVSTIVGTGRPWMQGDPAGDDIAGDPRAIPMSSPWDVAWSPQTGSVVVAMAGIHQLWELDPTEPSVRLLAGTTNEGLRDGPARAAWLAQPSGLAVGTDGGLWVADAETSALRRVRGERTTYVVETLVGTGLFDFGHRDGAAADALLQHPLGVTALPDGGVAVCDTYNDAVRRYDPATGRVTTMATGLREPSDALVVAGDDGSTYLLVVESAAHRLTRLRLPERGREVSGEPHRTRRPVTDLAPGPVSLEVVFTPPAGQALDERDGPATRLHVTATPPALLREGEGRGTELRRRLVLDPAVGDGVLHVAAMAASCDHDPSVSFSACHVHQQDWGVPVRLVPGAGVRLELVLHG